MLALQEMLSMEEEEEDYLPESPNVDVENDNTSDEFGPVGKKKSRGRPRKNTDGSMGTPRKRGRPPGKKKLNSKVPFYDPETGMMVVPVKRPRGRPRKHPRPEEDYNNNYTTGGMNTIYNRVVSPQDNSLGSNNEDSSNSDESTDFSMQNSNVKLLVPSDYEITSRIKDLVNTVPGQQEIDDGNNSNMESNNNNNNKGDTDHLRGRLEEHFGVNLQYRQFFIQEVYEILSY